MIIFCNCDSCGTPDNCTDIDGMMLCDMCLDEFFATEEDEESVCDGLCECCVESCGKIINS